MNSKTAAIALRGSTAYRTLRGYSDVVEQVVRATWDAERLRVELDCLDNDDDYRALRGWEPQATTDGRRTACLDILRALAGPSTTITRLG